MTTQAIAPLGWRVSASMDVAAKNLDSNDRLYHDDDNDDHDDDNDDDDDDFNLILNASFLV